MVYIRRFAAGYKNTPTVSIHSLPHLLTASKVAKFTIAQDERKQTLYSIKVHPPARPFGLSARECNSKGNDYF